MFSKVKLGEEVDEGELLGTITDPIENRQSQMYAPFEGRVIGMAVNQVVMPGFAAFHIGRATSEEQAIDAAKDNEDADILGLETDEEETGDPGGVDSVEVISERAPTREDDAIVGESAAGASQPQDESVTDPADEDPGR